MVSLAVKLPMLVLPSLPSLPSLPPLGDHPLRVKVATVTSDEMALRMAQTLCRSRKHAVDISKRPTDLVP
jgi:hypothetical protein